MDAIKIPKPEAEVYAESTTKKAIHLANLMAAIGRHSDEDYVALTTATGIGLNASTPSYVQLAAKPPKCNANVRSTAHTNAE